MTAAKHFGDVHWDSYTPRPGAGWRMPSDPGRYISADDPYWGRILDGARAAYGDPHIRFDTDRVVDAAGRAQPRQLVFGDGTALPADGTVVYHDAVGKQTWVQNDDGTASLVQLDGSLSPPASPVGYRKVGDRYAPLNAAGQQIAPQLGGIPESTHGFFTDPKTGVLTPKNARGDYYTLGPGGTRVFFDHRGAPITEQQYDSATAPPPPPDAALPTTEQQSGKAADAVRALQDELKHRFSTLSEAEERLSEALLTAHATSVAGQQKLDAIQQKIVEAVQNPAMNTDTAAGEKAYLTFLRSQVSTIQELLTSSSLTAEDQSNTAQALAALYAADDHGAAAPQHASGTDAAPAPAQPAAADPGPPADAAVSDPGLGPAPAMPDPSLADLASAPLSPLGADPMSALGAMLPGALGSLGGLGGSPLDALGGLTGGASPLAGLASNAGTPAGTQRAPEAVDRPEDTTEPGKDTEPTSGRRTHDGTEPPHPPADSSGQPTPADSGPPPSPAVPAVPASPTVTLPDGSTATARSPQAAQAVRDYLAGGTVDAAYRQNGLTLPPVGTPVTSLVDPTRLTCGDIAMFKDHYEPVLSSVKGYLNGQVVPLAQVTSSPDFLGFIDPTAVTSTVSAPAAQAPAPAGMPAAAPPPAVPAAPLPTG